MPNYIGKYSDVSVHGNPLHHCILLCYVFSSSNLRLFRVGSTQDLSGNPPRPTTGGPEVITSTVEGSPRRRPIHGHRTIRPNLLALRTNWAHRERHVLLVSRSVKRCYIFVKQLDSHKKKSCIIQGYSI